MQNKKTTIMVFCGIAIALNIALGFVASSFKLPLYLDVIGTIFIAVYYGPYYGAITGALTNLTYGLLINPKDVPFLIVSVAVGLIVGFISRRFGFKLPVAIITGLILSIVCPLIGTPIGVWVYGGLSGTGADLLFLWLQKSGESIFVSSFLTKITSNLLDKVLCCILVSMLISSLPSAYKPINLKNNKKAKFSA